MLDPAISQAIRTDLDGQSSDLQGLRLTILIPCERNVPVHRPAESTLKDLLDEELRSSAAAALSGMIDLTCNCAIEKIRTNQTA